MEADFVSRERAPGKGNGKGGGKGKSVPPAPTANILARIEAKPQLAVKPAVDRNEHL